MESNVNKMESNFSTRTTDCTNLEQKASIDFQTKPTNSSVPDVVSSIVPSSTENIKKKITVEDFEMLHKLGKGAYAKVYLARNRTTEELVAIKIIDKKFVEKVY